MPSRSLILGRLIGLTEALDIMAADGHSDELRLMSHSIGGAVNALVDDIEPTEAPQIPATATLAFRKPIVEVPPWTQEQVDDAGDIPAAQAYLEKKLGECIAYPKARGPEKTLPPKTREVVRP